MKLPGHAVELVGELLQLVVGLDLDPVSEVAVAEALGPGIERLDRNQHTPRQQHAGENRHRETECDQHRDADQEIVDRRQRLTGRLFEQNEPAELAHRARRGQHRLAFRIRSR